MVQICTKEEYNSMIDDVTNVVLDEVETKIGFKAENLENNIDQVDDIINRTVLFSGNFGPLGDMATTNDPSSTWFGSMLDARKESEKSNVHVKLDIRENYDRKINSNPTRKLRQDCMIVFESDVSRQVYKKLREITDEE